MFTSIFFVMMITVEKNIDENSRFGKSKPFYYLCGMPRYTIDDTESKAIKKSLVKWGEIPVRNQGLKGTIIIKNYRKYQYRSEVDIEFKGEIFVRLYNENRKWYSSDIITNGRVSVSKVKLNRYIRKNSLKDIQMRMRYFGVNIDEYQNVNKIKWS